METIKFNSEAHELFYKEMLARTNQTDVYYKAFFYCMGICETTRKHIEDLFDFKEGGIMPEHLHQPYQTGTSYKVTRMAYNLWNGYVEEGTESLTTPSSLFACEYAAEFHQAIKIRFSEYYRERDFEKSSLRKQIKDLTEKNVIESTNAKEHSEIER
ncbi:hypothetical protein Amet_3974 [Alkaliphilus metalliredigens QYMF]|uniref:Uncharacterized protein n=1 Tax=Alkaliphilus metalliredigens (strain QYMF) TaxID=293826 RepID=A6TV41_ALKMQ|nr:DUF6075 family protein [Alkaliphilus metalliredigens]ABR50059.1 hypothetical protein Amet_3974 [Alkaliphilus metalliredigens QYMF]